jgi:hypothetical protein
MGGRMPTAQKRAVVQAVARMFAATPSDGPRPPDAVLTVGRRRILLAVAPLEARVRAPREPAKPRLRFDKVALRFIADLRSALREAVPVGKSLIVTVTAPIRLASKTAAALEDDVRARLARSPRTLELAEAIHGNEIRARLVNGGSSRPADVVGFVHNPDSDPAVLLDAAQSLIGCVAAAARGSAARASGGERWLAVVEDVGLPLIETYRTTCSQLAAATVFARVLMVAGERVESLTE